MGLRDMITILYPDNDVYRVLATTSDTPIFRLFKLGASLWMQGAETIISFVFMILCHMVCRRQKALTASESGVRFEHSGVLLCLSSVLEFLLEF